MKNVIILSALVIFSIVSSADSSLGMEPEVSPKKLNEQFQLKYHEPAIISNGLEISILDIEDSRCPSDVTCVWEGEVKISVNVIKDKNPLGNFTLTSRAGDKDLSTQTIDNYSIQVIEVEPYPVSTRQIPLSDYVVTLVISEKTIPSPLKQFKSGIALQEIKCKPSYHLVIKLRGGLPACIKETSVARLTMQGWVLNGKSTTTLTEGQRDGPLLVQEIFPDHVVGLNFVEYPLARENGLPVSLKIGESASNGCTVTVTLEKIENKTAIFSKITDFGRLCPIC